MTTLFALILACSQGFASVRVEKLGIEARIYAPYVRLPEMAPFRPSQGVALLLDVKAWRFFWRNRIHAEIADPQFRNVGWEYSVGLRPFDWLELGHGHHSQHLLNSAGPPFPLSDYWLLTAYLIRE